MESGAAACAEVEFPSQGVTLRGRVYARGESGTLRPAVVMAHGFSATITMVADKYAEVFARAGFVVLLYDHEGVSDAVRASRATSVMPGPRHAVIGTR